MVSSRNITLTVFLFVVMLAAACTPTAAEPGLAPEIFITPGPTETILLSNEEIMQDNCNGGAMMSQTVERAYTVSRIVELGTAISVDAGGRAGIPGVGEVGVGAAVASHYNVSYGSEETVTRSVTVATEKGQHILHTVRQNMLWETGTLVVAGATAPIPYRFRKDFSMETLPPANIGCPGGAPPPTTQPDTAGGQSQEDVEPTQPVVVAAQPTALEPNPAIGEWFVNVPVKNFLGESWTAPANGTYSFSIASGAYNGWPNDTDCANAVPDRPGCWRTRLYAYIGCEIIWERPAHSPEMSEPARPSFGLGDLTYMESLEAAETFAAGMAAYNVSLNEGDCIRFVAIDGYNPATNYSAYEDNRGDMDNADMMRVRITGPQ